MEDHIGTIILAVGLAVTMLSGVGSVVWRLGRSEMALRAEYTEEISAARKESAAALTVLSAKLYQVEIWARDEFVRKGSFENVVSRLERTMELMGTKIETAVDKMATEIKNLPHREH